VVTAFSGAFRFSAAPPSPALVRSPCIRGRRGRATRRRSSRPPGSQINGSLEGALGGFGEGGFYYIFHSDTDHAAMAFSVRYSVMHDIAVGGDIPANNVGIIYSLFYNL